jgi:hypothetical protein
MSRAERRMERSLGSRRLCCGEIAWRDNRVRSARNAKSPLIVVSSCDTDLLPISRQLKAVSRSICLSKKVANRELRSTRIAVFSHFVASVCQ